MQIAERIRADVTTAMKAGERERVAALRLVLSELQKAEKDGGADELAVLRRERKRRREAETAYREAGREELAAQEASEAALIEGYLPQELSDAELEALVKTAVESTGASSPRDMGRVIKQVMEAAGGRVDGKRVSTKVKEALS
ncbi:GatB/YqeY domain-containing protein [Solirubrobacter phytolaccae]|uniref:GatB/YqeY domain-containing protein n=1 Tax=Solirubrobacter phytolaccae TaxID=1404360 RepID=A0A9X3N8J4_9ACTN|nr:GatB/YqeY domain-containing protein [Solirubrobacter phytolaccae]MDA0181763.1 GatB/YqeY domain-containing protein [Solirubrobacter phytolaccae]